MKTVTSKDGTTIATLHPLRAVRCVFGHDRTANQTGIRSNQEQRDAHEEKSKSNVG